MSSEDSVHDSDRKKKGPPKWLRWVARQLVELAVSHLDLDGDGKVEPHEVITWLLEEVVQPALEDSPKVRT